MREVATWYKQRPLHRRRWLLLIFTLVVSAGLCKLALWQWQRAAGKEALLAQMAAVQQGGISTLARLDWRHPERLDGVLLRGRVEWVSPHIWLLDNQVVEGRVGYDVLIPVRAVGDASASQAPLLLVDLGWLPASVARGTLPVPVIPAALELDGLLRISPGGLLLGQNIETGPYPNRIQAVRVAELAEHSGLLLADALFYQRLPPFIYHYQWNVMPPQKHRAYALQWLGLALVVLVGGLELIRRESS